ncbi:MAG: outer membrane beta-barrel protein [Gemmatimonadaceae bacterium]|nr:outer membrane beta-barrel protein [Gemmatimonadaceae bacterium]
MRRMMLALTLLLAAAPLAAQSNPQTREGFWISFGFGYGSLGCEGCDERESGTSGYLRLGGTLSQRLLIGGEVNMWSKSAGGATLSVGNIGPVLYFYPNPMGGLFLKGGLGMAQIDLDVGAFQGTDTGVGVTLGVGYDARVGRNFALTPYFDLLSSSFDGGTLNTVAFGLGFTWP